MSKLKRRKSEINSKIEAIKKINDDPKKSVDQVYDKYLNDLISNDPFSGKKLGGLTSKGSRKKNNNQDIFSELIKITEQFLYKYKTTDSSNNRLINKSRIKNHAIDSIASTTRSARKILMKNIEKGFFSGDGICGGDVTFNVDSISLSPKEFDLFEMLTIDPSSTVGQILYEPQSITDNKQKVNRNLYNIFTSGVYDFDTINQNTLFSTSWNSGTQKFDFSGLTQSQPNIKVSDFFKDYYSSVEMPQLDNVIKNAMLATFQGNGSESIEFTRATNEVNRIIKKLLRICGSPVNTNNLTNQNAGQQFQEDDEDIDGYFDFNNVEGIDIDDEDTKFRKVLKFTDCNNYEIPINTDLIEDFVYFSAEKTLDNNLEDMFKRGATDAFEQSDGNIPLINFQASLMNSFILELPKAILRTLLSAKIFLPMVLIYKITNSITSTFLSIKDLFIILKRIINGIIKDIFWMFITEFWKRIKRDLLEFLTSLVLKILKAKYSRYVRIITSLINLLTRLLSTTFTNCLDLFSAILNVIQTALAGRGGFNVPGILLGFADQSPGYSQDRAFLNITERLSAAGIPTGPINGEPNDLLAAVKSMIDGQTEEMDQNGFMKGSNKEVILATPFGPLVIPPGIINVAGKSF
jgi:hypothetical protein